MFLEEKLDILKNSLSEDDLSIRFTDYKSVMSKIESTFLTFNNPNYKYSGWIERIDKFEKEQLIGTFFENLLETLEDNQKYWWVFVDLPCFPNSRHRIYDATIIGGKHLSFLFTESPVFVIHKKYEWMMMFDRKAQTLFKLNNYKK